MHLKDIPVKITTICTKCFKNHDFCTIILLNIIESASCDHTYMYISCKHTHTVTRSSTTAKIFIRIVTFLKKKKVRQCCLMLN